MGNFFSNIGNAIKKGVVDTGHFVGKVASNPLVDAGIGAFLGPGAAAAAGGLGHLLAPGGNIGEAVKGGVVGGASGLAGQGVRSALGGLSGGGGIAGKVGGVLGAGAKAAPVLAGATGGAQGGGGLGDLASQIGGYLTGNGGGNALAIAQGANAAYLGKKSSDMADNALGSVQQNWDERAPLRTAGYSGMLNPGAGIASKLSAIPNHNIYSQPPRVAPAGPPPMQQPSIRPAGYA